MNQRKLPEGLHPDTLAIRAAAERSQYGLFVGVCKDTGHMAEMRVQRDLDWENEIEERAIRHTGHEDPHERSPCPPHPAPPDALPGRRPGAGLRDRGLGAHHGDRPARQAPRQAVREVQ